MKKWKLLDPDQKKVRVIAIISIIFGVAAQITFIVGNLQKGIKFDLTLFGGSFLTFLSCAIVSFFAIIMAFMKKDKPVL